MTDDELKASFRKSASLFALCLEQAMEGVAQVVMGERRLAVVPRRHPKVKEGLVYELRLVKRPDQEKAEEAERQEKAAQPLSQDVLDELASDLDFTEDTTPAEPQLSPRERVIIELSRPTGLED